MKPLALVVFSALFVVACAPPQYVLVPAAVTRISTSRLFVKPGIAWNRVPFANDQRRWEAVWTQNGPRLDVLSLVSGLPEGKTIIRSYSDDVFPVPPFRADMSDEELVSMVRAAYQARGVTTFVAEPAVPAYFLGGNGLRFTFRYRPDDGVPRKGVCALRVVDRKFYALTLDAESTHYFGALTPEFERLVASATVQ